MADHIWSVLCESVSIDLESKNISLFKCLEQVEFSVVSETQDSLSSGQRLPIRMELVSLWSRSDSDVAEPELPIRIRLKTPDGQRHKPIDVTLKLGEHIRARHRLKFAAIPYGGEGMYWFQVQQQNVKTERWKAVADVPLQVSIKHLNEKSESLD